MFMCQNPIHTELFTTTLSNVKRLFKYDFLKPWLPIGIVQKEVKQNDLFADDEFAKHDSSVTRTF